MNDSVKCSSNSHMGVSDNERTGHELLLDDSESLCEEEKKEQVLELDQVTRVPSFGELRGNRTTSTMNFKFG